MISYGFSVWLVPQPRFNINTVHIPHITVATCFEKEPIVHCTLNKRYGVTFFPGISKFPSDMYDADDVVSGTGLYCKIDNMELEHEPHMTFTYDDSEDMSSFEILKHIYCDLYVVDTRSKNPIDWKLLKKY